MTLPAVTLFMLAAMPFIAAIVGYFVLGEILRRSTLISMVIAFIGVCIMIMNDTISGSALGAILGFISATAFALYTVTIRWKPETPKFTTVVMAGIFCSIFSLIILDLNFGSFTEMPLKNSYLSLLHGGLVASGLILYSLGAKYLPSAELALLSLMEVVGGVLWVWMPIFGINEVPSLTVIIGGIIITFAVLMHGIGAKRKGHRFYPSYLLSIFFVFLLGRLNFVQTLSRAITIFSICSFSMFRSDCNSYSF